MRIQPWNLVFLIGLISFICIRGVYGRRTKSNIKTVNRMDGLEKTLLAILNLAFLAVPIYLFTPWLAFADYHLPAFVPWCGAVLMVAALGLFHRAHVDLGQNWSFTLVLREGHELALLR